MISSVISTPTSTSERGRNECVRATGSSYGTACPTGVMGAAVATSFDGSDPSPRALHIPGATTSPANRAAGILLVGTITFSEPKVAPL